MNEWETVLKCDKALVYLTPKWKFFLPLSGNNCRGARISMAAQIKKFIIETYYLEYDLEDVLDAVDRLSDVYTEIDIAQNNIWVSVAAKNYGASCKDGSVIILDSY